MSEELIQHKTGNPLSTNTAGDAVDFIAETTSSVGQEEADGLEVVEKAFDSREKGDDGSHVIEKDEANAATIGNQAQVACRLIYKGASIELEPIDSHSTFEKLVEGIDAKIVADGNQEDIVRLEYNHIVDEGASIYSVVDTSSLQAVLQLFRKSYGARKRAAIEALVTQIERLVHQNEADSIEEAARIMESLLQTKLSVAVQLRVLKTLVAALQTKAGTEGSVTRELLERTSLVFIVNGTGKVHQVMHGEPFGITGKLFPQNRSSRQPELSAFGGLILTAIASTPPGARILLQPDCFPEILARILQTPAGFRAETAAKALTAAISASEDFASTRIAPESIMLLTKLLRRHDSWEVRQCVASILAIVGRRVYTKETRVEPTSESCLFSSSSTFLCDDHRTSETESEEHNRQNSSKSLADNTMNEVGNATVFLDNTAGEAVYDPMLGATSQDTVGYTDDGWKELLRHPQVLSSAIESAQVASREVMPAYKNLEIANTNFANGKHSAFANLVQQCVSSVQTSTADRGPNSGTGRIGRTVALTSKCCKAVSSTLEISAHLAWLVSHCLTGHEDWVSATIISALLEMALYPLSPPELRCVAVHCTATLAKMCRHAKFAKILAKERDILNVIRTLSKRDALPNVQCWALTILQALLEVSTDIQDELVVTHFRSSLASQMLQRAHDARYSSFMTLGAHVLASLTQLTLEHLMPKVGVSETIGGRRERTKMLARSTVMGMSNYTRSIITLLHDGPPASLRYTAVHLWLLSRIPHIRDDLVQRRVVTMLVPRIEAFIRVLCPRRRISSSTPEDEREKWESQRGLVKGLDDTGRVHTLNQLAATLWMLLQSHRACNECTSVGANTIVKHIVELHGKTYATARRLLLCCLWQLAYYDTALQRLLLEMHVTAFFVEATPSSQTSTTHCDAGDEVGEPTVGNKGADIGNHQNNLQTAGNRQRRMGVGRNDLRSLAVHQLDSLRESNLDSLRESNLDSTSLSLINAAAAAVAIGTSAHDNRSTHDSLKTASHRRMAVSAFPDSLYSTFHEFLGYIGCHGDSQGIELRLVACRFYYYLVECEYERAMAAGKAAHSGTSEPHVGGTLNTASLAQIHETALIMAVMLLQVQGPSMHEAHEHGALIVAKEARSASRKLAFARAGMIEKLMYALRQATSSRDSQTTTAILHALFNISTHPANQVRTIRSGFALLIRHGRGSPAGTHATAFATRILENCRYQPGVASTYYKGELRFKSRELRRRAAAKEVTATVELRKPCVASDSTAACHRSVIEDVAAENATGTTAHGDLHQSQQSQKCDSSKFKHRFESFLHKLGQDSDDVGTKIQTRVEPALATVPVRRAVHDMQAPAKPETCATPRMPTLNTELSRSIIDIWGKSRPASGSSQSPVFSPRSTWSPRITSCQIKRCDKLPREYASSHEPQRPTEGKRQIAGPKAFSVPPPAKAEDANSHGKFAAEASSYRGQDVSNSAAHSSEQSRLNMLLRRRKPNPMSIAIEGGCKFTFHRLDSGACEEVDHELDDSSQEIMVKFPHIEGSRVSEGLFDSFELPDGTFVYYYYRGRHHGRYVGVSKSYPILPAEDLYAIIGEAQIPGGPKSPDLPHVFWPGLPDSSQPRHILKRMRERRLNGRQMLEAARESHDPTPLGAEYLRAGAKSDLKRSPTFGSTRRESLGGHSADEISFDNILTLELPSTSVSLNLTTAPPNDTTVSLGVSPASAEDEKCDDEWRIQDSVVWTTRGPEMAHPGSSRDYVHNQRFWARCALHDWGVMMKRTRFTEKLRRVVNGDDTAYQAELEAIKRTIVKNAELTSHVFHYFSAVFGSNTHSLSELAFKEFATACKIPDRRSKSCNVTTITTIFIEANVDYPQANEKRKIAASESRNIISQLVRFEFVQALILLANAKYATSRICDSLAEALQKLLDENVARVGEVEARASYDPDIFRTHSLYNPDVEAALSPHLPFLQELYKAYNPTTAVKRRMSCADFHRLMNDANFYDDTFTRSVCLQSY